MKRHAREEEEASSMTIEKRRRRLRGHEPTRQKSDIVLLKDLKERLGSERHVNVYKIDRFIQDWFEEEEEEEEEGGDDDGKKKKKNTNVSSSSLLLFESLKNDIRYTRDVFKIYGRETVAPRRTASFGNPGTNYRFSGASHPSLPLNDPNSPYYETFLKKELKKEEEDDDDDDDDDDERKKYWPSFLYDLVLFLERWMVDHFLPVMKKHSPYWKDILVKNKKEEEEEEEKIRFDDVLINRYETGKEYIGYHADSESDLKKHGIIVSISLGATRDFCFQPNTDNNDNDTRKVTFKYTLNDGDMVVMTDDTQKYTKHAVPKRLRCKEERINLTFRQMK